MVRDRGKGAERKIASRAEAAPQFSWSRPVLFPTDPLRSRGTGSTAQCGLSGQTVLNPPVSGFMVGTQTDFIKRVEATL
jgi:hypothetical protein